MKIDIKDLMDDYIDVVNIDIPDAYGVQKSNSAANITSKSRKNRPLLVAATLLLVVTAAVAAPFVLSRTAGHGAMTEGAVPMESVQNELPTEVPAGFAGSSLEAAQETAKAPAVLIAPHTITGAQVRDGYTTEGGDTYVQSLLDVNNIGCYGNMVNIDGTYYTLTDNGPELLETTNLHTTVELYGTWEVAIDYAVVDGELAFFYDYDSAQSGAYIDGEWITEVDYREQTGEKFPEGTVQIVPNVAVVCPVDGSADTVMLQISLRDESAEERGDYAFFYNIFTGEISNPLANVPELFDHGSIDHISFNSAHTRAILGIQNAENYIDTYICDLVTGEMILPEDLAAPILPEPEHSEGAVLLGQEFYWASDDMLIFTIAESFPNGKEMGFDEEKHAFINDHDYLCRLCAYDMATGTVQYQLPCGDGSSTIIATNNYYNSPYMLLPHEDDSLLLLDTAVDACYLMDLPMEEGFFGDWATNSVIYHLNQDEIYWFDFAQKCRINLAEYLDLPDLSTEEYYSFKILPDNWLCLMTEDTVYSYHIPDDLPMTPLVEQ